MFLQPESLGATSRPSFSGAMSNRIEPEYQDAYDVWRRNPDTRNTTQLLKAVSPEIDRGITAHVGQSNPLIRSRAKMLTLRAIRSYDPQQARLGTHIVNQLQGLKRIARQQSQILPIPERVSLDRSAIARTRVDLTDSLGREPSMQELADKTGLSIRRIRHVQKFRFPLAEGTTMQQGMDDESSPSAGPAVAHDATSAWLELVYSDQDGFNQKIMEWTLGLHGQPVLPNHEIARRLGVSQGAISQRKAKLQQVINQEELNPFNV